ncbi:MAG: dihydrolipoamide acetyltransferase family protein [Thermomicrobiales bacterium]
MATVIMPKMGDAMEEGTLLKWLKNVGEEVSEGDALAEIETDKVTLELEAQESGFLTNTLVEEGAVVPIGAAVATIGAESEVGSGGGAGEDAAPAALTEAASTADEAPAEAPEPVAATSAPAAAATSAPAAPVAQVANRAPGERLRASPLVKRLAEEHGIDLNQVPGTGPGGRIIKNDLNPFLTGAQPAPKAQPAASNGAAPATAPAPEAAPAPASSGAAPKGTKIELARIRRTTGKRMAESKATIPHYYVTISVDMTDAMAFRKQINEAIGETGPRVSVNDLIVKAAALALRENPNVNTAFVDGELYQQDSIDINIAISLDGGLIAPFVPAADQKSLGTIARMTKDLGARARNGGLTPEEYQGGTFTISNLGMFDVEEFIAVINPPQAAILAVGSIQQVPVVRDGEIAVGNVMKLTLSADHRALDGAEVATFLGTVKKYLQNPVLLSIA